MEEYNSTNKPRGYWTPERCFEEAQKYFSKQEFRTYCSGAYNAARKHGWLKDYTWFKRPSIVRKWTEDACFKEAKKYKTLKDFKLNCSSAYSTAYRKGWIKNYTWFEHPRVTEKYTYDHFIKTVKRYKTLSDFRNKERKLYYCAKKNKWLDAEEFQSLTRYNKPCRYWTKEKCQESALKYDNITDFRTNDSSAYNSARRNGWLKEITTHMKTKVNPENVSAHKHVIYVYTDEENHYAYVGLTNSIKRRHRDHCDKNINDVLYQHFEKYNLEIPEPEITYDNLTSNEAQEKEKEVYYQYRDAGWNMINAESALGSLGSKRKWSFKKVYKIAIKYKTKKEFIENDRNVYEIAKKYHYLEKFTWLKHGLKKWEYDNTYDEAKKYKTSKEFCDNAPGAYSAASKHGWLKYYTWLNTEPRPSSKRIWDYQKTYDEAKKYKTLHDFRTKSHKAYDAAVKYKWLKDYTWLEREQEDSRIRKWDYQTTFNEAKKYDTVRDFRINSGSAYTIALVRGWLEDYTWLKHSCVKNNTWTEDACLEEAKKYKYVSDFKKYSGGAYSSARRHGWLKDYTWLERKR